MPRRCCLQHVLPVVPRLWLPWLALSRSTSTLLLQRDVNPLGARSRNVRLLSRRSCLVCRLRRALACLRPRRVGKPSPSCLVVRPLMVAPPAVKFCIFPGTALCGYARSAHIRPCAHVRLSRCAPGSGVMSDLLFFSALLYRIHVRTATLPSVAGITGEDWNCLPRWDTRSYMQPIQLQ